MCFFLSKKSPEVLRDSVFVYKRSPCLLGPLTDPRFEKKKFATPLAARFGGRNFHSATEATGKLRRETRPSLGLPKKKGGRKEELSNHVQSPIHISAFGVGV